jgi:YVTN family beta-propeller protein
MTLKAGSTEIKDVHLGANKLSAVYVGSSKVWPTLVFKPPPTGVVTPVVVNSPVGVALSPDSSLLYVANNGGGTVEVVDTATKTVVKSIPVSHPYGLTISPDGSTLLVCQFQYQAAVLIDTATYAVRPITISGEAVRGAFSLDGTKAYVSSEVIDVATATNTSSLAAANYRSVTVSPNGKKLYGCTTANTIEVIKLATGVKLASLSCNGVADVIVSPDGKRLYATGDLGLSVFDADTDAIIKTVHFDNHVVKKVYLEYIFQIFKSWCSNKSQIVTL